MHYPTNGAHWKDTVQNRGERNETRKNTFHLYQAKRLASNVRDVV